MKTKSNYFFYFVLLFVYSKCIGQADNVNATISRIISPSPTAAALGKYGDVPVDESTGIPKISIPLYEVKANNYTLPISLSYYAGGIKVEDRASWTGLGWSLNAGGVITRTVRGKPDESGYTGNDGALIPADGNVSQFTYDGFMLLLNAATGVYDLQPDEYFFNFAGYSGKFIFSADGTTHLMPASNISIIRDIYGRKPRFRAITPDGVTYTFTATEITDPGDNGQYGTPISAYESTWYLTAIDFPDSKQTISLEYANYSTGFIKNYFYNQRWEIPFANGAYLISESSNNSTLSIAGLHLSKINFPDGYVQFIPKNEVRQDLSGDQILEYVKVFDNSNSLVKNYKLEYTYYNSSLSDVNSKRLRLERVQQIGINGASLPPYSFTYNNTPLPYTNSFSQDHWGFYNGKPNSKLIPAGKLGSVAIAGADREIDTSYVKAGILEKITYPTGGTTTFQYEANSQYANEKQLVDASQMVTCNSGPGTNAPNSCVSESPLFTFANLQGDVKVITNYQYLQGNTANVFLVNVTTGGMQPLLNQPPYYLTGIDKSATYKLRAETYHEGGDQPEYVQGTLLWKEYNNTIVKSKPAPGLRIKKIITADGIDASATKIVSYEYDMFTDAGRSSGYITGAVPTYQYSFSVIPVGGSIETNYVSRFSRSQSDLGGSDCVYYKNVKKIIGTASQNGYTNSYYGIENMNTYCSSNFFPFAPCATLNYKNSLLTRQTTFNASGKIVKDDLYTYYFDPTNNLYKVTGMAVGFTKRNYNYYGGTQADFNSNSFDIAKYDYFTEWYYLKNMISTMYDQNGLNPQAINTDYAYNNPSHMLLSATTVKNSIGDEITQAQKYPLDYLYQGTLVGSAQVMQEMINRHIMNLPVEEYTYKLVRSVTPISTALTSSQVNLFKISNGQVVKDASLTLKLAGSSTAVALSNPINLTAPAIRNGQFTYDARYELLNSFDRYDLNNNLLQLTERKGIHAIIREPGTGQAWAKSERGKYTDIAYSSFEHSVASNFTNWTYNLAGITSSGSQSGLKGYNLSGNPINTYQSLNPSQKYKISFWRKADAATVTIKAGTQTLVLRTGPIRNGWQYYEASFNNSSVVQISGTALIDELRLFPIYDQLKSYVFKPGVGLIGTCNENNQTTFWEYDEFNRLKLIRDQDRNILKKNEYNYQQIQ